MSVGEHGHQGAFGTFLNSLEGFSVTEGRVCSECAARKRTGSSDGS